MALYQRTKRIMALHDCLRIKNFIPHQQKANIHSVDDANQSEPVNEIHPLILTTGPHPGSVAYDEQRREK